MTNPNPGPAETVTPARSVSPATSVTPAATTGAPAAGVPATDLPYVAPSQTVSAPTPALPADHRQVIGASAPPPPKEAYQRASADPKERAEVWHKERAERNKR